MKENQHIEELRQELCCLLRNYNGLRKITLIQPDVLTSLIFKEVENEEGIKYKTFAVNTDLIKKLDLTGVSFNNVSITGVNFTGFTGVKLNPQTVFDKCLYYTVLAGVEFIGPFDDCLIEGADFTGSCGAIINWETIIKETRKTNFTDTEVINTPKVSEIICKKNRILKRSDDKCQK